MTSSIRELRHLFVFVVLYIFDIQVPEQLQIEVSPSRRGDFGCRDLQINLSQLFVAVRGTTHFLQLEKPEECAAVMLDFPSRQGFVESLRLTAGHAPT